jgi:hypothetical protein
MNSAEHHARAEQLLSDAAIRNDMFTLGTSLVHALLAVATALSTESGLTMSEVSPPE